MTVYSFYIFDRHTECVYQRRWTAPPPPNPTANGTNTTPSTSRPQSRSQISRPSSTGPFQPPPPPPTSSSAGISPPPPTSTPSAAAPPQPPRPHTSTPPTQQLHHQFPTSASTTKSSNDAKLLFGVVFSLRNLTRRLGGPADDFISYSTAQYKLHYYETATNLKFCMMTDPRTGNLRVVLHQIWANLWVEFVVRNPLSPIEHGAKAAGAQGGGGGVGNELFEMGLDRFICNLPAELKQLTRVHAQNQVFNPT